MRRLAVVVPLVFLVAAACSVGAPQALAPTASPAASASAALRLPQPIPQPITRTSAAAQNAWIAQYPGTDPNLPTLTGIDPSAQIVGHIDLASVGTGRFTRSADGSEIWALAPERITVFSALDGKRLRTLEIRSAHLIDTAFSPDGQWFAELVDASLRIVDVHSGAIKTFAVPHDANAKLPGAVGNTADTIWSNLIFGPNSHDLFALSDEGGPPSLTWFTFAGLDWSERGSITDGRNGITMPSCGAPNAVAMRVMNHERTLVGFCHLDGSVMLFDVPLLASPTVLRPEQRNPFWLSPLFTPDGQLLYLHNPPAFGDSMQVVDIAAKRLAGPVNTPTQVGAAGPFAWLGTVAYAGGVAATVPISPDGLRLYSATANGVVVLRNPDLAPMRRLGANTAIDDAWVSGDGRTVYGTTNDGVIVMSDDGSRSALVMLGKGVGSFVASEHG